MRSTHEGGCESECSAGGIIVLGHAFAVITTRRRSAILLAFMASAAVAAASACGGGETATVTVTVSATTADAETTPTLATSVPTVETPPPETTGSPEEGEAVPEPDVTQASFEPPASLEWDSTTPSSLASRLDDRYGAVYLPTYLPSGFAFDPSRPPYGDLFELYADGYEITYPGSPTFAQGDNFIQYSVFARSCEGFLDEENAYTTPEGGVSVDPWAHSFYTEDGFLVYYSLHGGERSTHHYVWTCVPEMILVQGPYLAEMWDPALYPPTVPSDELLKVLFSSVRAAPGNASADESEAAPCSSEKERIQSALSDLQEWREEWGHGGSVAEQAEVTCSTVRSGGDWAYVQGRIEDLALGVKPFKALMVRTSDGWHTNMYAAAWETSFDVNALDRPFRTSKEPPQDLVDLFDTRCEYPCDDWGG